MTHAHIAAHPYASATTCPVDASGAVHVLGLPYRPLAADLRATLARAGNATVVVDADDVEAVLVRDPRDGVLVAARCLVPPGERLGQLLSACMPGPWEDYGRPSPGTGLDGNGAGPAAAMGGRA
ncbi:hypothetical protein [Lichenibacterium dinghuense]|uniref:hypothetical protein n=1 Tax=Lichenibacterium dinghuense TaxID=2895977 RepID=UPI001F259D3D|nr:hypothetical protein [Lichenibacterium sp. 6Y81]